MGKLMQDVQHQGMIPMEADGVGLELKELPVVCQDPPLRGEGEDLIHNGIQLVVNATGLLAWDEQTVSLIHPVAKCLQEEPNTRAMGCFGARMATGKGWYDQCGSIAQRGSDFEEDLQYRGIGHHLVVQGPVGFDSGDLSAECGNDAMESL